MYEPTKIVWANDREPKKWVDADIVVIPKKGDLSDCDSWKGVRLLDVVGKVFSHVLQQRL